MFYALLTVTHILAVEVGAITATATETALVPVEISGSAAFDPVTCRQAMISAGRADLSRRGAAHGSVALLGGESVPVAVDPAADLRLATWR